ncbi:transposase, partial [Oceaniovalibus sp. ACAM 378]|uniref:integrase core domain-containing protein n=1 Tax=Oceaniovalibus sp. ACAM 378 TaxID=2599923 RepID=UPI002107DDDA
GHLSSVYRPDLPTITRNHCPPSREIRAHHHPKSLPIITRNTQLMKWAEEQGINILHIQPGKPQQNAYIERHSRTVRHEWLDQYVIDSIEEAQDHATQLLWTYNNDRPNMGIGGITPA